MKREEFLNQLEYLLQDIGEDEKRDAIDYYRDYLEEAGPEQEEEVLKGFGSPERIAAIIRTDLLGGMESGGEFTEKGYEDLRFEKTSLPALRKDEIDKRESYQKGSYADKKTGRSKQSNNKRGWLYYAFMVLIILIGGPIILAAAVTALGGAVSVGGLLLALLLVFGCLTAVGFLTGIGVIIFGISRLFLDGWFGLMCIGIGISLTGVGCLMLICSILLYGKLLPWLFKIMIDLFDRIFRREKRKKAVPDKALHGNSEKAGMKTADCDEK